MNIRGKFNSHRDAVDNMRPLDAVQYLLDVIESAQLDNSRDDALAMAAHGFTLQESIALNMLLRANGAICSHVKLADAISRGRQVDDYFVSNMVAVRMCGIRKKLPQGFAIQNLHGVGYRLVREPGALLPWETV